MRQHLWKDEAKCFDLDTNIFFDRYEEDNGSRPIVDSLCMACPVAKTCFAVGVSGKEWGVWGGIYLEGGEISKEFNSHKSKQNWGDVWKTLTMEKN
jgi:predicted AlkP superfamily phosphohydrolase/phosphomutase